MALTLSQILPPTRSGRTFFAASSLLGLCAFLQLSFLGWYFVRGGARTAIAAQAPAALGVPTFAQTMQPTIAKIDLPPTVTVVPTNTAESEPTDPPGGYATLPQPTPAPAQRLPGGASGDALEQARALRQRGDMRAALSRLREALVAEPDNAQAIAEMALTYEAMPDLGDKATEQWQRIYNLGESVGALYYLADAKLHGGANGLSGQGSATKGAGGPAAVDGTVLKITDINVEDIPDPAVEKKVALKIVVKSRPGVVIDPEKVRIDANFYDLVDGTAIMQTNAQTDYAWLTPKPINWANDKSEVLEALYVRSKGVALMPGPPVGAAPATTRTGSRRGTTRVTPKGKGSPAPDAADTPAVPDDSPAGPPVRTYLGYSVRLYYAGQLQEVQADPVRLLQDFQAPLTLPADNNPVPDNSSAPR